MAGKVVVVTGAASGIGRATSVLLAAEGAAVVVADVNEAGAGVTARSIVEQGGQSLAVRCDVTVANDVAALVTAATTRFGRLDVLHNNAYWAPQNRPVVDTDEDEWDRALATSLKSVYLGCKYAIPAMLEGGGGSIVNTASTAGLIALPRFAAYTAAKGGVVALTRSVALDYGPQGIRCNAVCPGLVETPATAGLLADEDRREVFARKQLLGRFGQPTDIAAAVLFLASDESAYMTGQTLVVDGGRLVS
jgi:NAD(P)-dependent dehydrogenase (short-subunit alcohol dehydrogenase family)